jgi:hypothetical protein
MIEDENHHAGTTYIVLRQTEDGFWSELAETTAHHAAAAAKRAAKDHLDPKDLEDGVQLRAITARAWAAGLVRVRTEHKTRIVTS